MLLLADLILVIHAGLLAFMLVLPPLVLLGWPAGVRRAGVRIAHLLTMGFIAGQAWWGATCPLTVWESDLREAGGQAGYQDGFIADWLHRLMFFEAPPWVFIAAYTAFLLLVAATFWWVPLRRAARVVRVA